ncbi:MAG TPA: family 1 glycosylhydrolase, partial [Terriglobales bacterium]
MDQLELSGHAQRPSDLDLLAEIGFKAVRYPVLWERVAANGIENIDWSWSDQRLAKLRQLGIRPIIGLVHHGSGPLVTNLLDPSFPERLAEFARAVAERYPWVDAYTPINEPLTTARFSCLYGHWYPHLKNDRSFLQALFHQCRAIVLAMREVRQINSQAQLIQTEDLAKVHSTPELAYQADFENERRWLPFDLLCGSVDSRHPLWGYFHSVGVKPAEFSWFQANPCPPDIMGMNYYLTGERFLDHRLELYPNCPPGGNGRQSYVDVEAARVLRQGIEGSGALLREAWRRFHLPLAITELHNGCTREEQARWFLDQWNSAAALLQEGIDLRAITAWALLGSFNWNTLVTREGTYEPGVYDVRGPRPHPTFLVQMLRQLGQGEAPNHPVL